MGVGWTSTVPQAMHGLVCNEKASQLPDGGVLHKESPGGREVRYAMGGRSRR